MADDPIASRYAQALFEAAETDGLVEETLQEMTLLEGLMRDEPSLRQFLLTPGVDPNDKVGVLDRALKGSWSALLRAFVLMVVSLGRAEFLQEIAGAFRMIVDEAQGRLRVLVRSAHPLPHAVLDRLRVRLEHRERKQVDLQTELDPALLGGVQIRLDHRVIDGSIQAQLSRLRQQLLSVRVH